MLNRLRSLTGRTLAVYARGLRVAAGVAELAARELRRDMAVRTATPPPPSAAVPDDLPDWDDEALGQLSSATAREVIAVLPELPSAALRRLFELESADRSRSSVLDAIERRLLPG
jgi:hypothetical protein